MKSAFIFFSVFIIAAPLKSQERFLKKANELLHEGKYSESKQMINRFLEKEPLQPLGMFVLSKWYSKLNNPDYDPDSAYSSLIYAGDLFRTGKESKLARENVFEEYEKVHNLYYNQFRDTLALLVFQFVEKLNLIEKYDYYARKYRDFSYSKIAEKRATHLRFLNVQNEDKYSGYFDFIQKYPDSEDVPAAEKRIYELEFSKYATVSDVSGLKNYISKYPNSYLIDSAWKEIHRLEYAVVITSNDISSLENYLFQYPTSRFVKKVEEMLHLVAFNDAKSRNHSADLRAYQVKYPTSPYVKAAFQLEMRIAWDETLSDPDLISVRKYISEYPSSPFIAKAKELEIQYYYEEIKDSENPDAFVNFLEEYPDSKEALMVKEKLIRIYTESASNYIGESSWEEALEYTEKIIQLDKRNHFAFHLQGMAYANLQEYDKAISSLNSAIEIYPVNPEYFSWRGFAYFSNDQIDKSFSDLTKTISLDPGNGLAAYTLALIYEQRGSYALAISYYRKALVAGFDVSDKIDNLEVIDVVSDTVELINVRREPRKTVSKPAQKPEKKLILPKQTLEKIKTIKK